jgi:hypothetical protein
MCIYTTLSHFLHWRILCVTQSKLQSHQHTISVKKKYETWPFQNNVELSL